MTTPMGQRIRERRKEKGLTLDQLAAKAECSKGYIWELENKNPPKRISNSNKINPALET